MVKHVALGLCLFLVLSFGLAFFLLFLAHPYTWHGSVFQPVHPAFDLVLKDTHNQTFQLSQDKGKIILLFFGYTHCPDECPLTLAKLKQVKADLGSKADHVVFVFVTVDPQRDTPAAILAYLVPFDPAFTGLTGSLSELEPAWNAYGVYNQIDGGAVLEGYQVSHSTQLYLIDAQGRLRLTYHLDNTPQDIEQDILYLVNKG
jgi:protein SCO1